MRELNSPEKTPDLDAKAYFKSRSLRLKDERIKYFYEILEWTHSNTAALLTHISAMIAALGIMLIVFNEYHITKILILAEIVAYTALAIFCIYYLRYTGITLEKLEEEDESEYLNRVYHGNRRNSYVYHFCAKGVLIVTLFFFATIIIHMVALGLSAND